MSKLTTKQTENAKKLLEKNNKSALYVTPNGHMYFSKSLALASVGGDEKKLEIVEADKKAESKPAAPVSETPSKAWSIEKLKAYAAEKSIDLGDSSKKDDILAKVLAVKAPEPGAE